MSNSNWFKANSDDNSSGSIVVSFSSHWEDKLRSGEVSLVFRRRFPKSFTAKKLYIYIGSPESKLIGVANIDSIDLFSLQQAFKQRDRAAISKSELEQYFKGYEEVGGYWLSDISLFDNPLSFQYVNDQTGFTPPQSFVRVSSKANQWLDKHS